MSSAVTDEFDVVHGPAHSLLVLQQPEDGETGRVMGTTCTRSKGPVCVVSILSHPPKVQVADVDMNVVLTGKWFVCAHLRAINVSESGTVAALRGHRQVPVSDGIAIFTDLEVVRARQQYFLSFSVFRGMASSDSDCNGSVGTEFAMEDSGLFRIDYGWASQLLPLQQPNSVVSSKGYRTEGEAGIWDPQNE